jgi:hypothetical protein
VHGCAFFFLPVSRKSFWIRNLKAAKHFLFMHLGETSQEAVTGSHFGSANASLERNKRGRKSTNDFHPLRLFSMFPK